MKWFLLEGRSESGPFSLDQLRQMVDEGKVTPQSELRDSVNERNVRAEQILGLFSPNQELGGSGPVFRQAPGMPVAAHAERVMAPSANVTRHEESQRPTATTRFLRSGLAALLLAGIGIGSYLVIRQAQWSPPPVLDLNARLAELEQRITRWKGEQVKVQGVIKTLEEDREGLLWQFRRLGVYSPATANDTPRGQALLLELRSLTDQLVRLRKKQEEYDLAIFQSESKLRTIERSVATSEVLSSEAEFAELSSAVSAADAALAAETGASPQFELEQQLKTLLADLEDEQVEGLEWSPDATVILLDLQPRDLTVACYDLAGVKIEGSGRYRRALIPDSLVDREIVLDFLHPKYETAHRKLTLTKGERATLAVELTPSAKAK